MCDSGCTTHVCCDRSMFSTFTPTEGSTVSGIGGNASILVYGRVDLGEITLNNVAYIPSMMFNLISIKRASVIANVRFIFDQNSLSVIYPSNKVKQLGTVENGLYVLLRPSMWHHGEVSNVGSEVSFNTSNAVYDPLLPRPKNSLSTQVKFDESVFPLEGSNQTIDSNWFTTMRPFAKKRQKISIMVSDSPFPPLAICPEVWHKLSLCIIIKKLISGCGTQNALLPDGPVGRKDDHTDFL